MKVQARKRYTAEFKAQALELLETGKGVAQVAEDLCISSDLLYRWRRDTQGEQSGSKGLRSGGEKSEADELRSLRRENALLKEENNILKKAAIILGTKPQPNSGR
jgi:transposase